MSDRLHDIEYEAKRLLRAEKRLVDQAENAVGESVLELVALVREMDDMIADAWGIICNAGGGNWETQTKDWQEAAARFRERFHTYLDTRAVRAVDGQEAPK